MIPVKHLKRLIRLFTLIVTIAIFYVIADFSTERAENTSNQSVQLTLKNSELEKPIFYKLDNKLLVVVHHQQSLFVAYAYGTDRGCTLQNEADKTLKETCSNARYDYYGKPVNNNNYPPLRIPVYTVCPDKTCINLSF